jgi:hypothetical protein
VPDPPEEAVLDCAVPDFVQSAVAAGLASEAVDCGAPAALRVLEPAPGVRPPIADVLSVAWVASPRVPALPLSGPLPPFSTVELAWIIAARNGCTPRDTHVMTAIPARTAVGRSHPMFHCRSHPMFHCGSVRAVPPSCAPLRGIS